MLFVGNFKMNPLSAEEIKQYLEVLRREGNGKNLSSVDTVLCPPTLFLEHFGPLPEGFVRGAQNASAEKSGAFTGETSPAMLKNTGIEYVLLGHSERRTLFGETDQMIKKKTDAALKHFLRPIVCIGESREERDRSAVDEVLERQIGSVFDGLSKLQAESVILGYEPRWAIGTDTLPTTEEILSVRIMIRKIIGERFDAATAEKVRVIYGGSVKSTFLPAVSWEAGMDGVLVGRESLFPYEVIKMVEALAGAPKETL
jgi:triosephosphate isomerase